MLSFQSPPTYYVERLREYPGFSGRAIWKELRIHFDDRVNLGVKIPSLDIDGFRIYGVIPLVRDGEWYLCSIDYAEPLQ